MEILTLPETATRANELGLVYQSLGGYAKAENLLAKAAQARMQILGDEHPDVAMSLNNLGCLCIAMEKYDDAESLLRSAIAIHDEIPEESQLVREKVAYRPTWLDCTRGPKIRRR